MNRLASESGELSMGLEKNQDKAICDPIQFNEYSVFFVHEGEGIFYADFNVFPFIAPVILFTTPLQTIRIKEDKKIKYSLLQFHSDFYCIEYHKQEVACNGLLFNNIYLEPSIQLSITDYSSFKILLDQVDDELLKPAPSEMVLKSYLQLFLAKSSQVKIRSLGDKNARKHQDGQMEHFKKLLEENYFTLHKPSDYADLLTMSPNNFTKRCTRYFKKTPSQLITERLVLEAKKQLHLTHKSIKEIAYTLKFDDEFYFSRFFKKHTGVSPQAFRDKTGISIVADLYR